MRHVTHDMWCMTCDTWWGVNVLLKFHLPSFYGLGWTVSWKFWTKGSLDQWMNKWVTKVYVEQFLLERVCLIYLKNKTKNISEIKRWTPQASPASTQPGHLASQGAQSENREHLWQLFFMLSCQQGEKKRFDSGAGAGEMWTLEISEKRVATFWEQKRCL